jgi:hypothetical protein
MGLACYILEQNRRLKNPRTRTNIPSAYAIHGPLSGIATPAPPLADEFNSEMQAEDDLSFGALPTAQYAPVPPLADEINSAVQAEDDLSFGALPTAQYAPAPPFADEIDSEVPAEDDPPLSALSAIHCSARVAAWREKTLQERWNRSLEPIMEDFEGEEDEGEDEDEEEEEEEGEGPTADDDLLEYGCDEGEEDVWDLMESAPSGEEGISLWDSMGEHFIREAMSIGRLSFHKERDSQLTHQLGARTLLEHELAPLRHFAYKVENNLTEKAFNALPYVFPHDKVSSWKVTSSHVQFLSGFRPVRYDCCPNSCICYTGPHEKKDSCPECKTARFNPNSTEPQCYFEYLPIIPRLRALAANPQLAETMRYRTKFEGTRYQGQMQDIFDGRLYQSLLNSSVSVAGEQLPFCYFSDSRDIALGLSTDGIAVFKKRSKTSWPIVLFNYNLPPDIRFHKNNLIPVGVIPGPKKPLDMDSFLYPLVQELLQLEIGVKAFDALTETLFTLHAYLIVVLGDIPAVALLMRMKGHNAFSPCRMCKITGVRVPTSTTHYVPLNRQSSAPYDPSNLPMRTREGFIKEANEVQFAMNTTIEENLAKKFGIKGIPLLSSLSSLSFPASFPYDFMHLIWENLIPNLILFWTGEFKDVSHSGKGYLLETKVWKEICSTSALAGNTIPSAFGCRVPDMSTQRWQLTSESRAMWTLFIAPVVLRGRFIEERYYRHFLDLVRLLNMCLEYELPMEQVAKIEQGFIKWVKDYER